MLDAQFSRDINKNKLLSKEEELNLFKRFVELKQSITKELNRTSALYNKIPGILFLIGEGHEAVKNFVDPYKSNLTMAKLTPHVISELGRYREIYQNKVIKRDPGLLAELDDITIGLGLTPLFVEGTVQEVIKYSGTDPLIDLHVTDAVFRDITDTLSKSLREIRKIKDRLTGSNMKLVVSIATKYTQGNSAAHLTDLVQEGSIGLLSAIDRYDPESGNRFSTMATWWIRQSIIRYLQNSARTIRLPVNIQDSISQAIKIQGEFLATHRRQPTDAEMAAEMGISTERYHEIKHSFTTVTSLDAPVSEDEEGSAGTLQDVIESEDETPEEMLISLHASELIKEGLASLDEFERSLIELRYGLGDNEATAQIEVAAILEVARSTVADYEAKALERLKRFLDQRK